MAVPPPRKDGAHVHIDITALVKNDLDERHATGLQQYGVQLHPFDGRDTLLDAYQEALDLAQYLRKKIEEERLRAETDRIL